MATEKRNPTLTGSVDPALYEAIQEYRWSNRMSNSDVVRDALTEYARTRDLIPAETLDVETKTGDKKSKG